MSNDLAACSASTDVHVGVVVHADARPCRRADAQAAHQRLRAVVPGADAHALAGGQLGHVVGVHAVERERRQAAAPLAPAAGPPRAGPGPRPGAPACTPSARARARARAPCPARRGSPRPRPGRPPRRSAACPPRTCTAARSSSPTGSPPRRSCRRPSGTAPSPRGSPRGRAAPRCRSGRAPCGPSTRRSPRRSPPRRPAAAAPPARRRSATPPPRRGSRAVISATGLIVPSTFDTCANATSLHVPARQLRVQRIERELAVLVHLQVAKLAPSARGRGPATGRGSRGAPSA